MIAYILLFLLSLILFIFWKKASIMEIEDKLISLRSLSKKVNNLDTHDHEAETMNGAEYLVHERKKDIIYYKKCIYLERKNLKIMNFAMFFISISFIIELVIGHYMIPFFGMYAFFVYFTYQITDLVREYDYVEDRSKLKLERTLSHFIINLHLNKPPLLISILHLFITGFTYVIYQFILQKLI